MARLFAFTMTLASLALGFFLAATLVEAQSGGQARVTILADLDPARSTGIRIEGLVSDKAGMLYTSDLDSRQLYRIDPNSGTVSVLGTLPRSASGMAYDAQGNLYMASGDVVLKIGADKLAGNSIQTSDVMTHATGVTGANGLAFGPNGTLYVSGGATGNIYAVASDGITRTWASGFTSERQDQRISTNGLAFGPDGQLYSSNTGTGAIDRIPLNADGSAGRADRFVTDPLLLGADGITFAANGDLYVAANERNAIVRVAQDRTVVEVASNNNAGPLEFPASPAFSGNALYASNFDIARGANAPNDPGIGASIARIEVGVTGAPLPAGSSTQPTAVAQSPTVPAAASPTTQPTAPVATPEPTATAVAATPISAPEPTMETSPAPTTIVEGMPQTGGADPLPLVTLLALAVAMTLLGIVATRQQARR